MIKAKKIPLTLRLDANLPLIPDRKSDFLRVAYPRKFTLVKLTIPTLYQIICYLSRSDGEYIRRQRIPIFKKQTYCCIELLFCRIYFGNHECVIYIITF